MYKRSFRNELVKEKDQRMTRQQGQVGRVGEVDMTG
jgi:hypothetical protein